MCDWGYVLKKQDFGGKAAHCLRFEKSAGCEDAERPEVHSRAEPGNEEKKPENGSEAKDK
jgi:hypothetical protein